MFLNRFVPLELLALFVDLGFEWVLAIDDTLLEWWCRCFEETASVWLVSPLHGSGCTVSIIELRIVPLVNPLLAQVVEPWISLLRDWWRHKHFGNFEASLLCYTFRARVNLWGTTHSLGLFEKWKLHLEWNLHQSFFLFLFLVFKELICISMIDRYGLIN